MWQFDTRNSSLTVIQYDSRSVHASFLYIIPPFRAYLLYKIPYCVP
jgi:hypothetical protein